MAPKVDFKTVGLDGEFHGWPDYVRRVRLLDGATKDADRAKLGTTLVLQLTQKAWELTGEVDYARLRLPTGARYSLKFLEDKILRRLVPDLGVVLEALFVKHRRNPGESMVSWCQRTREAYRRVQRALQRARTPKQTRTRRMDTPSEITTVSEGEELFDEEPEEDEEDQSRSSDASRRRAADAPQPAPGKGTGKGTASSSTTAAPEVDLVADFEVTSKEYDIFPTEILGWFLLRRAGLTPAQRQAVLSSAGNKMTSDAIEQAMCEQEEEIAGAERGGGWPQKPKRTYWAEEEGYWAPMEIADEEDDMNTDWEQAMWEDYEDEEQGWWPEGFDEDGAEAPPDAAMLAQHPELAVQEKRPWTRGRQLRTR